VTDTTNQPTGDEFLRDITELRDRYEREVAEVRADEDLTREAKEERIRGSSPATSRPPTARSTSVERALEEGRRERMSPERRGALEELERFEAERAHVGYVLALRDGTMKAMTRGNMQGERVAGVAGGPGRRPRGLPGGFGRAVAPGLRSGR
jgi:hypothetical protein